DDIAERLEEEVEISFSSLALHEQKKRHEDQRGLHKVFILYRQGRALETIAAETDLTVDQVRAILVPPVRSPVPEELEAPQKGAG
ncbi:MAG: hypothetical protein AVDCRST_MAG93-3110, partial [uncultured Chloroflexia bacterium]